MKETLRRAWPVLVAYALFSAWGILSLTITIALVQGSHGAGAVSDGGVAALFGIAIATLVGHVAGNAFGLAGLRLGAVLVAFTLLFVGASFAAAAIGPFAAYLIVAAIAALSGYLGVASRFDVVAAWFPLTLSVSAAILWMNAEGKVATFSRGSKYAVWDGISIVELAGAVFFMLVFLATRHALGLSVWQSIGRHGTSSGEKEGPTAVARPGRGSLLVLAAFTVVVLGVTAAISPYLFRTAPAEKGDGSTTASGQNSGDHGDPTQGDDAQQTGQSGSQNGGHEQGGGSSSAGGAGDTGNGGGQGHDARTGKNSQNGGGSQRGSSHGGQSHGKNSGTGGSADGNSPSADDGMPKPDTEEAKRRGREAGAGAVKLLGWLAVVALGLVLLAAIAFQPIRRAILLRHLREPMWAVSPTRRIMNLWQRAIVALADAGVTVSPGETARDFARRADEELTTTLGGSAPGLHDAAAIVEKVEYAGRGLGPRDDQAMKTAVDSAVRELRSRMGVMRRIASLWGAIPEGRGEEQT